MEKPVVPPEHWEGILYGHNFHIHLLASDIRNSSQQTIRVLDAGCGTGRLMLSVARILPHLTGKTIEVFGFDVREHHYRESDAHRDTLDNLARQWPHLDWEQQIAIISSADQWPYPDGHFDYVVSNQVLEHVHDLPFFFKEHSRVLAPDGKGLHSFPTQHVIMEPHVFVPWAHRIHDWCTRKMWMQFFYCLGLGERDRLRGMDSADRKRCAAVRADYVQLFTNYQTVGAMARIVKAAGLRCTFRYTPCFYSQKIRQILTGDRCALKVRPWPALLSGFATWLLRYVATVVMVVEKTGRY